MTTSRTEQRRATRLVLATTLAAVVLLLSACGPLRMYKHTGFTGATATREANDSTFTGNTMSDGSSLNDQVSSYRNDSARWAVIYEHSDYGGVVLCLAPGASVFAADRYTWRYSGITRNFDNKASSVQFHDNKPPGSVCTWTVEGAG